MIAVEAMDVGREDTTTYCGPSQVTSHSGVHYNSSETCRCGFTYKSCLFISLPMAEFASAVVS